jgi:hypothetical protein
MRETAQEHIMRIGKMVDIDQTALALLNEALKNMDVVTERLEAFRASLEALGLEIRSKNDE